MREKKGWHFEYLRGTLGQVIKEVFDSVEDKEF